MIKNLSELQVNSKHATFAKKLTKILSNNNIEPSPVAFVNAFNKAHVGVTFKAHTVRKWLLGNSKPRHKSMLLLAEWLKVNPSDFQIINDSQLTKIEIDFKEQEVIAKFLTLNIKQKAAVSLLIESILDK